MWHSSSEITTRPENTCLGALNVRRDIVQRFPETYEAKLNLAKSLFAWGNLLTTDARKDQQGIPNAFREADAILQGGIASGELSQNGEARELKTKVEAALAHRHDAKT